jgi:hypothetical protein
MLKFMHYGHDPTPTTNKANVTATGKKAKNGGTELFG